MKSDNVLSGKRLIGQKVFKSFCFEVELLDSLKRKKICKNMKAFLTTQHIYLTGSVTIQSCEYKFDAVWAELVRSPTSWENTLPVTLLAIIWELFVKTLYRTGQWYFPTTKQKDMGTKHKFADSSRTLQHFCLKLQQILQIF